MRRWLLWLRALVGRRRLERDIEDELQFHIEQETALLLERGLSPAEARRQAKLRFGSVDVTKSDVRRVHGVLWLDDARLDVRVALRGFAKRPGLAAGVVTTLSLGLGASVIVFAAVSAVLLQDPPYREPERLAFVWQTVRGDRERLRVPGPDAAVVEASVGAFDEIGFLAGVAEASLETPGSPAQPLRVARASSNWFRVLGVEAALGRGFTGLDSAAAAPAVWLLDDRFFRSRLGGDRSVIGRSLVVSGREGVVIGVLPASYRLLLPPELGIPVSIDVWEPIRGSLAGLRRPDRRVDQDADDSGVIVARLRAGATHALARAELEAATARLAREVPAYAEAGVSFALRALHADAVARARGVLNGVFVGVVLVLALAVVNAAGLLLTRAAARSREMAVRASLGAAPGRLVRQIVVENAVLVGAGLAAGLGLAALSFAPLASYLDAFAPGARLRVDPLLVLATAVAGGSVVAVTSGVVLADPSLRAAARALIGRGAVWSRNARRLRDGIVAFQVALSFALLAGAGVMIRTASALSQQDLGFRSADVLTFRIGIAFPDRYRGPAQRSALVRSIEARIGALDGVQAVGFVGGLPLADPAFTQPWALPGDDDRGERANYRVVTAGYFDALGTRLLAGRLFRGEDDRQDRRVVIVDTRLAARLATRGDAVGRTLRVPIDGEEVEATVIGIVENVRFESPSMPGRETIYVPYRHEASRQISAVVRATGDLVALAERIRAEIAGVDAGIAVHDARPMTAVVAASVRPARAASAVLATFAAAALLLAVIGLHAAVAYAVTRRTAEIGVRMALGATGRRILGEVMRAGLMPLGLGLSLGLALVIPLGLALRTLVFGVKPLDVTSMLAAATLLAVACSAAGFGAARRATLISPARALDET